MVKIRTAVIRREAVRQRLVLTNDRGQVVGEFHHRAKLTDAQVDQVLLLRDDGMSYRDLSRKFDVAIRTIRDICSGRCRSQIYMGQRYVVSR